jgi:hypothetical protein
MATRDSKNKSMQRGDDAEEMTVVLLKFKGSGDTLQRGFDAVNQAIATLGGPPQVHRVTARVGNGRPALQVGEDVSDDEPMVEGESEEVEDAPVRSANGVRKVRPPKFDTELNLKGDGTAWKDYAAQKGPTTQDEKYLVAASWLTKHGGHPTFKLPQIFSCFRTIGWEELGDFSQPMRKLKVKKSYFENPEPRTWKLTSSSLNLSLDSVYRIEGECVE